MRAAALLPALGLCAALTGCTPTVALTPAPDATSVACAGVVARLPPAVGQASRRNTDAQGTAAWGDPAAVTLRCGVTTPEASSARCVTVDRVDWLLEDRRDGDRLVRVLTTYGREPGVQVVVTSGASADDALLALSDAVAAATTRGERRCSAYPTDGAAPSASPSS